MKRIIIGAGMSGLIAAYFYPDAKIYEAQPRPTGRQPGLHFLHSTQCTDQWLDEMGLMMTPSVIHGGIFWQGIIVPHSEATPAMVEAHVLKTRGTNTWNLTPTANASLMNRASMKHRHKRGYAWNPVCTYLTNLVRDRITWNKRVDIFADHLLVFSDGEILHFDECISTVPLSSMHSTMRTLYPGLVVTPMSTYLTHVPETDMEWSYIYYPTLDMPFYRISWPLDTLRTAIIETTETQLMDSAFAKMRLSKVFTKVLGGKVTIIDGWSTELGHIVETPRCRRLADMYVEELQLLGYQMLGRFAQWKHKVRADTIVKSMMDGEGWMYDAV